MPERLFLDADVLVTGDRRHFGELFGKTFGGVIVLRPRQPLALEVILDSHRFHKPHVSYRVRPVERVADDLPTRVLDGQIYTRVVKGALLQTLLDGWTVPVR